MHLIHYALDYWTSTSLCIGLLDTGQVGATLIYKVYILRIMKIVNRIRKRMLSSLQRGVVYKIGTTEDPDENYFQTLRDVSTQRRLRKAYFKDPNDMDQQDVAEIFSDVLKSMTYWKTNQPSYST